jgi:hypothetical protein
MTEENKSPEQLKRENQLKQFAQLQQMRLIDLDLYPYRTQEKIIGKYTREQLKKALDAPELDPNQKQLRNISKFLYNASSHYKNLVSYFAEIPTLDHYIDTYSFDPDKVNIKKLKKSYFDVLSLVENMNIKHEFSKVLHSVFKEGVFFGYKHQNNESFFIQQLDADYCKITFIEDGLYGFAFNFAYFFIYPERLNMFPDEFKRIYKEEYEEQFKKKRVRSNNYYWSDLSSENTICIKYDETSWYAIPPFIGLFESLLDISDFKELQKAKEVIDNYKLITMKIPLNESSDEVDDYAISAEHAQIFQHNVESVVPDQIGVASVPLEVNVIDFERDRVDKNKVADATSQYFKEAGISEQLFSTDTTGAIGVGFSVKTDEAKAFTIVRQIERWINRMLKNLKTPYKFRIIMPNVSLFNQSDLVSSTLTNTQFGLPEKLKLLALSGSTPSSATTTALLENEVLQLDQKFKPLASAHTQAGENDKGGAPKKDTKDLSKSGAKTRDNLENDNKTK